MNKRLLATLIGMGIAVTAVAQDGVVAPEEDESLAVLPEFTDVDANEDGMIDEGEAGTLTKALEEEHQIQFQFEAVDANRDGLINGREYVAYDRSLQQRLGIG